MLCSKCHYIETKKKKDWMFDKRASVVQRPVVGEFHSFIHVACHSLAVSLCRSLYVATLTVSSEWSAD